MNHAVKTLFVTLALAFAVGVSPASAQQRKFPDHVRLGTLEILVFPKATLDGRYVTLAPGTRIHDRADMLALPSTVQGPVAVLYRLDTLGQVAEAWILTPEELRRAKEAAARGAGR